MFHISLIAIPSPEEVTRGIFHMCPMLVPRKLQILVHFRFFMVSDGKRVIWIHFYSLNFFEQCSSLVLKEFFIYCFILFYLCVLSLHVFWVPHMCLELGLQMAVRSHVGAGSWPWVLCKSNKCFLITRVLSGPSWNFKMNTQQAFVEHC